MRFIFGNSQDSDLFASCVDGNLAHLTGWTNFFKCAARSFVRGRHDHSMAGT